MNARRSGLPRPVSDPNLRSGFEEAYRRLDDVQDQLDRIDKGETAPYTQTYATADRTLEAYIPDEESTAYTGIDNAQAGAVYAKAADLEALRVAVENLRLFVEDLAQLQNAVLDDLQARKHFT